MIFYLYFIQTWFIGEAGRDTGGVTRELWRLLSHDVMRLCEGQLSKLVFRHDSDRVLETIDEELIHLYRAF